MEAFLHCVELVGKMKMQCAEKTVMILCITAEEKKEVRGDGGEDLTLQMVCQLHSNNKIQTSAFLLPACCSDDEILTSSSRETL